MSEPPKPENSITVPETVPAVKSEDWKYLKAFAGIAIVIIAIQIVGGIAIAHWVGTSAEWAARGAFGEMFSAVNTLFSGLAFAAFVVTLLMQRDELRLQREQLEDNRKELERSASAQERTERLIENQLGLQRAGYIAQWLSTQPRLCFVQEYRQDYGEGSPAYFLNLRNGGGEARDLTAEKGVSSARTHEIHLSSRLLRPNDALTIIVAKDPDATPIIVQLRYLDGQGRAGRAILRIVPYGGEAGFAVLAQEPAL